MKRYIRASVNPDITDVIIDRISKSRGWSADVYTQYRGGPRVMTLHGANFDDYTGALISITFIPQGDSYDVEGTVANFKGDISGMVVTVAGPAFDADFETIQNLLSKHGRGGCIEEMNRGLAKLKSASTKKNTNGSNSYKFLVCNNESAASRGTKEDTFSVITQKFDTDEEAWEYAVRIIYNDHDSDIDSLADDCEAMIHDQDTGAGFPIVYGIMKNGNWLYQDPNYDEFEAVKNGTFEY